MIWYNETTDLFMKRGYLRPQQTIQEKLHEMAEHSTNILGKGSDYYKRLMYHFQEGNFIIPTPVWKNFFKESNETAISCFGVMIEDTVESIVLKASEVALQNKIGGGSSGSFQKVRRRGSRIGEDGFSNGSVSMMSIYQEISNVISQPNRRGHFSATQDIEHGDAYEFMDARTDGHKLQDISTGVKISDAFMQKVLDGDEDAGRKLRRLVRAKFETGFHYCFFTDNVNNNTVDVYKEKGKIINHSNMCQPKDATVLLKKDGVSVISTIGDIKVGDVIWGGKCWTKVVNKWSTGIKQVNRYKTTTGSFLGTDNHRIVSNGVKVKVDNADSIDWCVGDHTELTAKINAQDVMDGLVIGDGSVHKASNNLVYLIIGEKDQDYFKSEVKELITKDRGRMSKGSYEIITTIKSEELPKTYHRLVPERFYKGDETKKRSFLRGLFSANGSVVGGRVVLTQTSELLIRQVQEMLSSLGIHSYITITKGRKTSFKNGDYVTKDSYTLNITSGRDLFKKHIGFLQDYKVEKIPSSGKPKYLTSDIKEIESVGVEEVFEITVEHEDHTYWTGGVLVSNCQEIALPNSPEETFVCNLLGMNVVNFDKWKDTDAVEIGIYFMDSMLQDFLEKMKRKKSENEDYYNVLYKPAVTFVENHMAMGMGQSGLCSYLQSKMIPFDSIQGRAYNKIIAKTIKEQAYKASEKMALEYGKAKLLQEDKYKRRHTTLLAIAPNTSSSFIMGINVNGFEGVQSQSIEPYVSNYFVKDVAKVRKSFKNPYLQNLLEQKGKNTEDVWKSILKNDGSVQHLDFLTDEEKDVFKTFIEIPQTSIIELASDRQKAIDQSQSLNLMVGADTDPDEVIYWILKAWKMGIKNLYYQLNVSSAQQFTNERSKNECSSCAG